MAEMRTSNRNSWRHALWWGYVQGERLRRSVNVPHNASTDCGALELYGRHVRPAIALIVWAQGDLLVET